MYLLNDRSCSQLKCGDSIAKRRKGRNSGLPPALPAYGLSYALWWSGMWRQATLQVQNSTPRTWEKSWAQPRSWGVLRTLNLACVPQQQWLKALVLFVSSATLLFSLYIRPPHQVALLHSWSFSSWVLSLLNLHPALIVVGRLSRNKIFLVLLVGSWTLKSVAPTWSMTFKNMKLF